MYMECILGLGRGDKIDLMKLSLKYFFLCQIKEEPQLPQVVERAVSLVESFPLPPPTRSVIVQPGQHKLIVRTYFQIRITDFDIDPKKKLFSYELWVVLVLSVFLLN